MLEADPQDSFVRFAIAKEFESLSQYDKALEQFLILKSADSQYIGLYYHLGKLYEKLENHSLAMKTYQEGISEAKKLKDFHALSELNTAKVNLEMEI
jgi:tetratricopeptide (TPR) repeat protein